MHLQGTAAEGREGADSTGVREDGNASVLGTSGPAQQTIHLTVRKGACSKFHSQYDALLLCRIVSVAKYSPFLSYRHVGCKVQVKGTAWWAVQLDSGIVHSLLHTSLV